MIGVHNILVQPRVRVWKQGDIALGSASFIGYRPGLLLGGLSPPAFKSGGAQAPPAPPISPPLNTSANHTILVDTVRFVSYELMFLVRCADAVQGRLYVETTQRGIRLKVNK